MAGRWKFLQRTIALGPFGCGQTLRIRKKTKRKCWNGGEEEENVSVRRLRPSGMCWVPLFSYSKNVAREKRSRACREIQIQTKYPGKWRNIWTLGALLSHKKCASVDGLLVNCTKVRCKLIESNETGYHWVALKVLYLMSFESESIRWSVGPQIAPDLEGGTCSTPSHFWWFCGRTRRPIVANQKADVQRVSRAITWCSYHENAPKTVGLFYRRQQVGWCVLLWR